MRYLAANSKNGKSHKGASGFSLIELLIVVAIILIIAAVAIPNFMRSKIAANESATVQNIRTITAAEYGYQNLYGIGYSATLADLGGAGTGPTAANLVDNVLASGTKSGYVVTYAPMNLDANGNPLGFTVNTSPVVANSTGTRYFYVDQTGVIRWKVGGPAAVTDPGL
jgi:type IV pilus assembly protein PilA